MVTTHPLSLGRAAELVGVSRPYLSKRLPDLRAAGLAVDGERGVRLAPALDLLTWLRDFTRQRAAVERHRAAIEEWEAAGRLIGALGALYPGGELQGTGDSIDAVVTSNGERIPWETVERQLLESGCYQ